MDVSPLEPAAIHEVAEARPERRVAVRDRAGEIVGYREHQHLVGRSLARDRHGRVVGIYDPRRGLTLDASGQVVGRGDLLATFLFRARP